MRVILKNGLAIILEILAFSFVFGVNPSNALEDPKVFRGVLVLEGKIVSGDYDKIQKFLGTKSNFDKINVGVFVASPGGNVTEAIKIGHLIRALRLSLDAPSGTTSGVHKFGESVIKPNNLVDPKANYLCVSACFLVYVSGVYRTLGSVGRLGIHRPIWLESNARTLSVDEALTVTWRIRNAVQTYLKDMGVPNKYVDLMYSTAPNEMRWITQAEFESDLQGYIPELRDWVSAKCGLNTYDKKTSSDDFSQISAPFDNPSGNKKTLLAPADQSDEVLECWMHEKTELSHEAWQRVFHR